MGSEFQNKYTFEERLLEAQKIKTKYPDRFPFIVEVGQGGLFSKALPELEKNKYLVPGNITMGQFYSIIRKKMKVAPEVGIFYLVGDNLVPVGDLVSAVYEEYKEKDEYCYITLSAENVFGNSV